MNPRGEGGGPHQPQAAVTGVGSLPLTDPEDAIRFVAAHAPELPFWPQLPVRGPSEGMLRQALGIDADLLVEGQHGRVSVAAGARARLLEALWTADPAITPDQSAAFGPFVRTTGEGGFPAAAAVKGQLAGPLTLVTTLGEPSLDDDDLVAALVHRVAARAAWQVEALRAAGLPVIVVLDEPVLGLVPSGATDLLGPVVDAIVGAGGLPGVHSCARSGDPRVPDRTALISLDLHDRHLPAAAAEHWSRGGILAAGLVPGDLRATDATALAERWLAMAEAAGSVEELAARTVVTPTCGLAGVDQRTATASFDLAAEVGQRIRAMTTPPVPGPSPR